MSTRSIIALVDGDGFTDGVYVHSDGYPSWMGPTLAGMAEAREGDLAAVHADIKAGGGWSCLYGTRPMPEWVNKEQNDCWVDGVGLPSQGGFTESFDWHGGVLNTDREWVWALSPRSGSVAVFVLERIREADSQPFDSHPVLVESVRFADSPDWDAVECGRKFERCGHCADYHFPDAVGVDIDTDVWLGRRPLTLDDATAVLIPGIAEPVSTRSYSQRDGYRYGNIGKDKVLLGTLDDGWNLVGIPGYSYVLPRTSVSPERIVEV